MFKLIIKAKDSNVKRKVGQRRNAFIAINFLTPKVTFTLVSSEKQYENRKANYGIIAPGSDQKRAGLNHFLLFLAIADP